MARTITIQTVLLLVLAILSSCVIGTQREGRAIRPSDVAAIEVGRTTRQEILDRFGPPTNLFTASESAVWLPVRADVPIVQPGPDEDVYFYEYWEDHEVFLSFLLLYTYFDRTLIADTLMVAFDDRDRVKNVAYSHQTEAGDAAEEEE